MCIHLKNNTFKEKEKQGVNDIYCINSIVSNLKQKKKKMLLELPTYKDMNCKDSLTS